MERDLLFGRVSVIALVLTAAFNGAAVLLACLGYGAFALVGGVPVQEDPSRSVRDLVDIGREAGERRFGTPRVVEMPANIHVMVFGRT